MSELHLCPICGREAMDLQVGKCTCCGADFGGVNAELYHIACERLRGELKQLDELKAGLEEAREEKEANIARLYGQDKLDIAKEAFNKGYEAGLCVNDIGEVVWENECQLAMDRQEADNGLYKVGEMGLCYQHPEVEVQVRISSWDRSAKHEIFSKLEGVPVRVTIKRVPGPSKKLGWTCKIQDGWEVKVIPDGFWDQIKALETVEEKFELIAGLENLTGHLAHGTKVLAMGIAGWAPGEVKMGMKSEFLSSPHVESKGFVWPLKEATDERKCWVTSSQINKKVFEMIK